jgi:hypothetical protein
MAEPGPEPNSVRLSIAADYVEVLNNRRVYLNSGEVMQSIAGTTLARAAAVATTRWLPSPQARCLRGCCVALRWVRNCLSR